MLFPLAVQNIHKAMCRLQGVKPLVQTASVAAVGLTLV